MINKVFKDFEGKHESKVAVLFGSGPSLQKYKPIDDVEIQVGTNFIGDFHQFNQSSDNYDTLDYYFFGDRGRCMSADFKVKIAKFGASEVDGMPHVLHYTEKEIEDFGAYPMSVTNANPIFELDISSNPTHGMSVIFHALNFLLYTKVSKIYIVGCDCSERLCFDGREIINSGDGTYEMYKQGWYRAKEFIENNNIKTEIISVNPVGLKGLFKEIIL